MLIGDLRAFEALLRETVLDIWESFRSVSRLADLDEELSATTELYASVRDSDFSRNVLTARPDRLGVIRLTGAGWTDLGQPSRVLDVLASRSLPPFRPRLAAS